MKQFVKTGLPMTILNVVIFTVISCQFFTEKIELNSSADHSGITRTPTSAETVFSIDVEAAKSTISPYIYGSNFHTFDFSAVPFTLFRTGGNRWSAYNWENNASNAGSDWYFWNDGFLSDSDVPGYAVTNRVSRMFGYGAAALITVPICGYVSKDKNQTNVMDETNISTRLSQRFLINRAFKGSALSLTPDTTDAYVYQDEFVNFIQHTFSDSALPIMYCLDNEPDLWHTTHEEIHPAHPTYEEVADKNIEYARAIKSVDTDAITLGFVSYGFNGALNMQRDEQGFDTYGDFVGYFLSRAADAEQTYDKRLIDVLDVHWYPEAKGDGARITNDVWTDEMYKARMQAPRSLWDEDYTEDSWIGQWFSGYLPIIPWLKSRIASEYPGTGLAISEYYYGGVNHISGAIAQADVLGIFGRDGLFQASIWGMGEEAEENFIEAAFNMYLNYDQNGSAFGDQSVSAVTNDKENTSVYASIDSSDPNKMVIVAINKSSSATAVDIQIESSSIEYENASFYQLTASGEDENSKVEFQQLEERSIQNNQFFHRMPGYSITTIELTQ